MKYIIILLLIFSVSCSQNTKKTTDDNLSYDPTIVGEDDFSDLLDETSLEDDVSGESDFAANEPEITFDDFSDEPVAVDDSFQDSFDDFSDAPPVAEPVFESAPPVVSQPVINQPINNTVLTSRPASRVENIQYFADKMGGTVVVSTNGDAIYSSRFDPSTRQLILELDNALLPSSLKRPYIMKDFSGASFSALNAYQGAGSSVARIVIQVKSDAEPSVHKEGKSIIIKQGSYGIADNSPVDNNSYYESSNNAQESYTEASVSEGSGGQVLAARTMEEFLMTNQKFYGRPISVEFRDAEIKEVIDFLADESQTNIVLSGDVKGTISVKLKQVPWDQALVIVMRSQELGYIRQGNVIRIAKTTNLQAEQDKALEIIEKKLKSAPLQVQMIPVNYSDVDGLSGQIEPFLTEGRGKIVADKRTSALIVTDTQENIQKLLQIVQELDVPPAQVLIEGKIVETTENYGREFGVNWNVTGDQIAIGDGNLTPSLRVNPGAVQGTGILNLQLGVFDFIGSLAARIALAESTNKVRVLSSPRITALNKESAKIEQSTQIPYLTTTLNDGVTEQQVQFQDFSVSMDVTPQITADESIIMEISVDRSYPTGTTATGASASQESSAQTKVIVKNGQTAVLGGIYQGLEEHNVSAVPGVSKIPILGWMFKNKIKRNQKTEMLIFLTPRIMDQKSLINKL